MKDNVSALECFQRALSINAHDWLAHNNLGMVFKSLALGEPLYFDVNCFPCEDHQIHTIHGWMDYQQVCQWFKRRQQQSDQQQIHRSALLEQHQQLFVSCYVNGVLQYQPISQHESTLHHLPATQRRDFHHVSINDERSNIHMDPTVNHHLWIRFPSRTNNTALKLQDPRKEALDGGLARAVESDADFQQVQAGVLCAISRVHSMDNAMCSATVITRFEYGVDETNVKHAVRSLYPASSNLPLVLASGSASPPALASSSYGNADCLSASAMHFSADATESPSASSPPSAVVSSVHTLYMCLGLRNADEQCAFLILYGLWCGCGWLDGDAARIVFAYELHSDTSVQLVQQLFNRLSNALKFKASAVRLRDNDSDCVGGSCRESDSDSDSCSSGDRNGWGYWDAELNSSSINAEMKRKTVRSYWIDNEVWWHYFAGHYGHNYPGRRSAMATSRMAERLGCHIPPGKPNSGDSHHRQHFKIYTETCTPQPHPFLPFRTSKNMSATANETESRGSSEAEDWLDDCTLFHADRSDCGICKWFLAWVWQLNSTQARSILQGLRLAQPPLSISCDNVTSSEGGSDGESSVVFTCSQRFRDQIIQLCIHAAYSVDFQRLPHKSPDFIYRVEYTDDEQLCSPQLRLTESVCRTSLPNSSVWCVTVPTDNHLILVRKVLSRLSDGSVGTASRPVVVGNTRKDVSVSAANFLGGAESEYFEKAIEQYKLSIKYGPKAGNPAVDNMGVVLTDFGTRLKLSGNTEKAIAAYKQALEYSPSYHPAYFNLGVVHSERGQFESALKQYMLAIEKAPNYVEALTNVGVIYKNACQLQLAIEYYERALRVNPNFTIAANNLAIALTDQGTQVKNDGRIDDGIAYYKRALSHNSKYPAAWYNLGVAYAEKNRYDDAKVCYELAILFDPKCAEAFNNLGVIYKDRGNLDQAIHFYQEALKANPKFSQTLNNLGVIYTMLGKLDEAHDFCSSAIKANSQYAEAHNNLGVLYRDEGRIDEAIQSYEACLKIDPFSRNAGQNRLLAMNSICRSEWSDEKTVEEIWRAHRDWGFQFAKLYEKDRYHAWDYALKRTHSNGAPRVLRVGYLSADFFTHSVSYFIEAPLAFADRSRTYTVCYSNVARQDKKTKHLQNLAHCWRNVHDKNAKEVAELIRKDKIDILVELTGHTAGNRLDVMALKPAPVAVTWIGYPNTTGLPSIDYRFTDDIVDPVDSGQQYSEELIRFQHLPFLCYTPPTDAPPVHDTPALTRGYVTFGSFNNLAKVNERVLGCWCEILKRVPSSRMLLKCKPFASQTVCNKILKRFADFGIDSERVDLIPLLPTTSEHLDTYSQVDISVDTFPYAGTTTTCEALYMGVPVVTFRKSFSIHAHNVGATLLSRISGMEQLIAGSEERYVELAVDLASDVHRLQLLRKKLRHAMLQSSICEGKAFTKNLEEVYYAIFERWYHKAAQSNGNISANSSSSAAASSSASSAASSSAAAAAAGGSGPSSLPSSSGSNSNSNSNNTTHQSIHFLAGSNSAQSSRTIHSTSHSHSHSHSHSTSNSNAMCITPTTSSPSLSPSPSASPASSPATSPTPTSTPALANSAAAMSAAGITHGHILGPTIHTMPMTQSQLHDHLQSTPLSTQSQSQSQLSYSHSNSNSHSLGGVGAGGAGSGSGGGGHAVAGTSASTLHARGQRSNAHGQILGSQRQSVPSAMSQQSLLQAQPHSHSHSHSHSQSYSHSQLLQPSSASSHSTAFLRMSVTQTQSQSAPVPTLSLGNSSNSHSHGSGGGSGVGYGIPQVLAAQVGGQDQGHGHLHGYGSIGGVVSGGGGGGGGIVVPHHPHANQSLAALALTPAASTSS